MPVRKRSSTVDSSRYRGQDYLDGGTVTGLTYVGGRLFAVSDKGELFNAQISSATNEFLGQASVNFVDFNGEVSRLAGKNRRLADQGSRHELADCIHIVDDRAAKCEQWCLCRYAVWNYSRRHHLRV